MFWRILRPRYWIADRRLRQADKRVLIVIFVAFGLGGQWAFDQLGPQMAALAAAAAAPLLLANMLLGGLYLFLLVALLGVNDLLRQLFYAPEMELLFVAPIPRRTLFAVKLWQGSRVILQPALVYAAVLLVFGAARGAPLIYYPLVLGLVVGVALLVTAVLIALVLLLARRLPLKGVRAWLSLSLALLPAALALSYSPVLGWLSAQTGLLNSVAQALVTPLRLLPALGVVAALALAAVVVAYRAFFASFLLGWNRLQSAPAAAKGDGGKETAVFPVASFPLLRRLPAPLRPFAPKEWLTLRRSPQRLTGLVAMFAPILLILFPLLFSERRNDPQWQPFFFWVLLVATLVFACIPIMNETLPALPREGRRLALLRVAPVDTAVWLRRKFWGLPWPLALLVWVGVVLGLALLWRLAAWQMGVIAAALIWTLLLAAALFYALGALFSPLTGADDDAGASGLATLLAMGGYALLASLTLATVIWLLGQWRPQSGAAAMLQPFAQSGVLRWLLTPGATTGWLLLGAGATAVALIAALWRLARRRLEQWEEVG